MHKLYKILVFSAIVFIANIFLSVDSFAIEPSVVISQIKLGDESFAKNEFIELYNNSETKVDITNWCIYYQSLSLTSKKLTCFISTSESVHIYLPARASSLAVSNEQLQVVDSFTGDLNFYATLSGSAGYIYLSDNLGVEIDKVGWNINQSLGDFAPAAPPGMIISRKFIAETDLLQDTDVNMRDFEIILPRELYVYGEIFELIDICLNLDGVQDELADDHFIDDLGDCYEMIDMCPNVENLQIIIPDGYGVNETGDCMIDVCINLDGLQIIMPDNMQINNNGECELIDVCINLDEAQLGVPNGYYLDEFGNCMLKIINLRLNEILANVDGVDDGNEFIEIYNPNNFEVDLNNYIFKLDPENAKFYQFPIGSMIAAGDYFVINNSNPEFSMKNSSGGVWLYTEDDQFVDSTTYLNPDEDESWALIDDTWQYTNRVTSGVENLELFVEIIETVESKEELVPCGPDQYRNPETNRCKNIATITSALVPCKEGQYRSEETNRCRNIVSDVIAYMPCNEGEERNPETNRCRKIVASSVLGETTLVPCAEGEERNPETNRCRKVVSEIPESDYKVEAIESPKGNGVIAWSIAGVVVLAIMYGVWEWRFEISQILRKLKDFARHN